MHIATKGSNVDISSEKKLREYANSISNKLKKGNIYFLFGEMGVGKTTFVKFVINDLQKKYNQELSEVTSPTFNILNIYSIGNLMIKHYDLFRLNSSEELKELNIFDKDEGSILFIEWPQIIKQKPKSVIELYFEYENQYRDRFIKSEI
tara:strand:- start:1072 stop:1518 length:447 start_codon:yes stop_codon:yes gene_type:complete